MFEDRDLKVLLGNSIELPEVDYDDADVESELGYPVEEEALKEFYFVTIVDHIKEDDFKSHYLSVINFAKQYPLKSQRTLVQSILHQIEIKHDYTPSLNIEGDGKDEIENIYMLLEFIEYNHEEFIVDVWKFLKPEINSLQLEKYCEQNEQKIMFEIEEQLESRYFPWTIADFLRTNNKENLLEWFCEKSKNIRGLIILGIIEEKMNGQETNNID